MEIIYNNILYNTRTQNELEEILSANFINASQEHFEQCVTRYQTFISGLVQMLASHKSSLGILIHDSIISRDCTIAKVDFMLNSNGIKLYGYIHNLSIVSNPVSFPLILK